MLSADRAFIVQNLVLKDFKIRYRNMSLGILWSILNPLIMMAVLVVVFGSVFPDKKTRAFPVFILCGLVPFNFFTTAWSSGMISVVENAGLVKRVLLPRALLPLTSVLANCVQMVFQMVLLLIFVLAYGFGVNRYWALLPGIWLLEILFVLGLVMASSALDVYVRDLRFIVDSLNRVVFWLIPIFYTLESVPAHYRGFYEFNPVAALVLALRKILMEASPPPAELMWKMSAASLATLAGGWIIFNSLQRRFYDHL